MVIAIIAILAAILFPVFAQARAKARQASCLSNLKQMGLSTMMYSQDYDETFYPHRFNCGVNGGANQVCPQYLDGLGNPTPEASRFFFNGNNAAAMRYYWIFMLQPYVKNYGLFTCPSAPSAFSPISGGESLCSGQGCAGYDYGGQNSYGHNDIWLSPSQPFTGGANVITVSQAAVPRVASTILVVDSTYYGAAPDVCNQSGKWQTQNSSGNECAYSEFFGTGSSLGPQYKYYWKNIGNSAWSFNAGESGKYGGVAGAALALSDGPNRHNGTINCQLTDGHVKAIPYSRVIGDVCLWTTDADGAHPNCN